MISSKQKLILRLLAVLILLGAITAWFIVPILIESAYHGTSWAFLNEIIAGQDVHTLEFYLNIVYPDLVTLLVSGLMIGGVIFVMTINPVIALFAPSTSSKGLVLIPGIMILLITLLKFAAVLVSYDWDWDVDHFMYSGGRLLAGDFHWTVEFDDKLPIVQALFVLPAMAHSIRAWQIMSALAIIAGCISAYVFLVSAIRDYLPGLSTRTGRVIAFYATVLMAYSFACLPGGISHINPFTASLAMMSIVFADIARRAFPHSRARFYSAFLLGTLCASIAIGIRPYFLYPLVFVGVWAGLKVAPYTLKSAEATPVASGRLNLTPVWIWGFFWITCTGLFGLVANVLPYIISGQLDVFIAAIAILAQDDLNPQTVMSVIQTQGRSIMATQGLIPIILTMWAIAAIILPWSVLVNNKWCLKRNAVLDIVYLVILCPLLLEVAILSQHFWPHYLQFFVPFMGIGIGLFAASLLGTVSFKLSRAHKLLLVLISVIVISVSSSEIVKWSMSAILKSTSSQHRQADQLAAFKRFLNTRPETDRDFLNPSQMYFHWQLNEPRHGFPHAANLLQVMSWGWWQNLKVVEPFNLPTNRDSFCAMLEATGPSLVVELKETDVTDCFLHNSNSKYRRVHVDNDSAMEDLWIFERVNNF